MYVTQKISTITETTPVQRILRAITDHDMDDLKYIIETKVIGVDETITDNDDTPYTFCAFSDWPEGMRYMASMGADINHRDIDNNTVAIDYVQSRMEVFKTAVELGSDLLYKGSSGQTVLWKATFYKDYGYIEETYYEYIKKAVEDAEAFMDVPLPDVKVAIQ